MTLDQIKQEAEGAANDAARENAFAHAFGFQAYLVGGEQE